MVEQRDGDTRHEYLEPRVRTEDNRRRRECLDPGIVASYLDGQLTGREREAAELHLAECDDCRELVTGTFHLKEALEAGEAGAEPKAERDAGGGGAPARPFLAHDSSRGRGRGRMWTSRTARVGAGVLALAAAVLLAVVTGLLPRQWAGGLWIGDGDRARQTLIREIRDARTTQARLTGFAWGPEPPVFRGPNDAARRSPAVTAAAASTLEAIESAKSADAHRAAGLAYLLLGDHDRAIERLEAARAASSSAEPSGELLSDLAAAYLERGRLRDRADDMAKAADYADRAARRADAPLAAWFNRALALEIEGQRDRSRAAWQEYLAEAAKRSGDRGSEAPWIDEAKNHLR